MCSMNFSDGQKNIAHIAPSKVVKWVVKYLLIVVNVYQVKQVELLGISGKASLTVTSLFYYVNC